MRQGRRAGRGARGEWGAHPRHLPTLLGASPIHHRVHRRKRTQRRRTTRRALQEAAGGVAKGESRALDTPPRRSGRRRARAGARPSEGLAGLAAAQALHTWQCIFRLPAWTPPCSTRPRHQPPPPCGPGLLLNLEQHGPVSGVERGWRWGSSGQSPWVRPLRPLLAAPRASSSLPHSLRATAGVAAQERPRLAAHAAAAGLATAHVAPCGNERRRSVLSPPTKGAA